MRMISLLLAILTGGCASDLVDSGQGPIASALLLTPDSTTVDIAATLQFEVRALWSDGLQRSAPVTYSATGGAISATGLFRAGPTPGVFLVIATCECGVSDTALVTVKEPLHATQFTLLPASVTIDTGTTLQFTPGVMWSDSANHPVLLTYTATGGSISPVGSFTSGNLPGQFQVIATCDCGLADTANVTIAINAPPPPAPARLTLTIAGLPANFIAQVAVSGPAGFARSVSATTTLDSLPPGSYEVRASGVTAGSSSYGPVTATQMVVLAAGATENVTVTYRQLLLNGVPPHPRVWMSPDRITRLQAQVAAGSPRWLRVKSVSDAQVAKGAAYSGGDESLLPDLCLSYLGTRDARYAQRAGAVLAAFAVEANDLKYDSGYGFRFMLPLVSMGLDWCYDGLSAGQRQQAATWLMNRADWVWPSTNPSRTGGWGTNSVDNNYWWGFMMTGPAALAAAGDDIGVGTLSGPDRPTFHRQLALAKWNGQAVPYFATAGEGGAWAEGTNYESSWRVGSFADAFLTAAAPVSTPFLEASLRWRLHSTMPGFRYKVPLGDQPRVSDASLFSYDRLHALYNLAPSNAGGTLLSQLAAWLNLIGQVPNSEFNETASLADELLRFDPAQPPAGDLSGLPKDYFAPGAGFFIYRTSWTDAKATVMAFESGPTSDHGARDANGLMIWKGNFWISASANIYSHSGIEGATTNYNNLTVGSFGQVLYGGNGGTIAAAPQVSDALVAIRGQAKNGYGYPNGVSYGRTIVSDYLRTVAYLPQLDVFVVVDRATVFNPSLAKVWRWHTKDVPQVSGNTFRLQSPSADFRCFGSVLSPGDVTLGTEAFALGSGGGASSNAVTVSMVGRASDVVVTVLQCTGAQAPPYAPTATVNALEAAVLVGGRRVVIPVSESQSVRIE